MRSESSGSAKAPRGDGHLGFVVSILADGDRRFRGGGVQTGLKIVAYYNTCCFKLCVPFQRWGHGLRLFEKGICAEGQGTANIIQLEGLIIMINI